ncbi:MAG: sugar ABC transporter ATP-binding protein [Clostridiales Family XIII bacterium]|jgi:ABC-type sugar transport system ATPase subunit|nr:sugar ABC transporter ATP-binding protein [Clostridiales Family XIII bacterium]
MAKSLELQGIGKAFPGVQALKDVSFCANAGKVLALLGENGAGKSTLLKIISGDLRGDEGSIILNGEEQRFESPNQALAAGISVIYQERQLVPALTVAENIFSGALPSKGFGIVDRPKLMADAKEIIQKFGMDINPEWPLGRLSIAYQQMVEIMKAYRRNSDVIAFDEPTAPLTDSEIEILFKLIRQLKSEGKVIIYVSHRMSEIFQITDEIVVLKDGKVVKTFETAHTQEGDLIKAMVGRDVGDVFKNLVRNDKIGEVLLEAKNVSTPFVRDISFKLHRGEVLGIAGLVGAGRTEVVRALFGADPIISGEILLEGSPIRLKSPRDAINHGIALCPEDRMQQGLIPWRSIRDNVGLPVLNLLTFAGLFMDERSSNQLAEEAVDRYTIKTPTIHNLTMMLSGGNQQKVILGRWTSDKLSTKILILDEPTKGIDVGTKAEIYQMICNFAREGISVIIISSEMTEVINLADNVLVMCGGRVSGSLTQAEATEENVLRLAMVE